MGIEIERKFLIKADKWQPPDEGKKYCQGYINTVTGNTVRVRIAGDEGYLTLKSKAKGISRQEFEYSIPLTEAEEILSSLCDRPLIEKIRYRAWFEGYCWEVDQFLAENQGLMLAEIELTQESENFSRPDWIAEEVTGDKRYYNLFLAQNPYQNWC